MDRVLRPPRGPGDPMDQALAYLGRRSRTVAETRRHLAGRGHARQAVEEVIQRLRRIGYLDDLAYTQRFAAWAAAEKPMGRARLAAELTARGVDRETIDRGLLDCFGSEQESDALQRALDRALRGRAGALDAASARRLAARLMRRGFPAGRVRDAVERRLAVPEEAAGAEDLEDWKERDDEGA